MGWDMWAQFMGGGQVAAVGWRQGLADRTDRARESSRDKRSTERDKAWEIQGKRSLPSATAPSVGKYQDGCSLLLSKVS